MIIQRNLLNQIKQFINRNEFIAICGPRQAGKTTFLQLIIEHLTTDAKIKSEHIHFVTFENRILLHQFETDPLAFVRSYISAESKTAQFLFIDEFQYAEDGGQKLKLIYDTAKNVKIIITGSSSLEIKAQVGKYMVGRILTFHLYPFSFREMLHTGGNRLVNLYDEKHEIINRWLSSGKTPETANGKDAFSSEMLQWYEQYCIWGGYPAVVLSSSPQVKAKVLGELYTNYVLKDIKGLLELATEKNLFLLSRFLAAQMGNIVVYHNLGQAAGLDFRQLKKHLNVLSETFVCGEIRPYFTNKTKELSKSPKIYFYDNGFRNYLIENMSPLVNRPDGGATVENSVFIRLGELMDNHGTLNFWHTKTGAEVDFVLNRGDGAIMPIEVKYSPFDAPRTTRSFTSFIQSFKPARGIILTKDFWGTTEQHNCQILFAPVYYL